MKRKIFVDGVNGTTGLKIHERLSLYDEIDILSIDYDKRRDPKERSKYMNEADLVFLCLPDDAAREAVTLIDNPETKVIDASSAHRTLAGWTYGLPELSKEHREAIRSSKRVANPGCHASAFILSIYPLITKGVMPKDFPVTCQSLTGYSGGGKNMIENYEKDGGINPYTNGPRPYGLSLDHKHLPEMKAHTGLSVEPVFLPVICNVNQGLAVSIPIHANLLSEKTKAEEIHEIIKEHYSGEEFVKVMPFQDQDSLLDGGLPISACNDTNRAEIFVYGNDDKDSTLIITRLDNLGKGASGAAIQNMNIMLGFEEGLHLKTR